MTHQPKLWSFAILNGDGDMLHGVAGSPQEAEAAVLAELRREYDHMPGCPVAYDDEICSDFSVEMGDGFRWSIEPVPSLAEDL